MLAHCRTFPVFIFIRVAACLCWLTKPITAFFLTQSWSWFLKKAYAVLSMLKTLVEYTCRSCSFKFLLYKTIFDEQYGTIDCYTLISITCM
jgi:hypothetical protein